MLGVRSCERRVAEMTRRRGLTTHPRTLFCRAVPCHALNGGRWDRDGSSLGVSGLAVMPGLSNTADETRKPDMSALAALVDSDLKRVNALILDRMHSPVALIPQLAGHIIAAGGKRLRPMLTLASAK